MKVALYQDSARPLDLEHNLQLVDRAAAEASAEGAELLITPELFATGYAPSMIREQLGEEAVGEAAEKLAAIARRHRIALVYSLPGRGLSDRRGINAALLDASGDTISEYQKVHLFGPQEKAAFVSGVERPPVVDYAGTKIALVICYDVEFPETVRAAAVGGADLIAVPTALAVGSEQVTRTLIPARALENRVTVAYANHTGNEAGVRFSGSSVVAGPGGKIDSAGPEPGLLFVEVRTAPHPGQDGPWYLQDRRDDLYGQWISSSNQ